MFDQTHILSAVGMLRLPANWSIGVRFRLVSGNPESIYTQAAGFDADTGGYIPVASHTKTIRQPFVHSLDVRIDKTFVFDWFLLTVYLDVQNAYNHRNAEFEQWNYDYSQYRWIKGLPILPSVGAKLEF